MLAIMACLLGSMLMGIFIANMSGGSGYILSGLMFFWFVIGSTTYAKITKNNSLLSACVVSVTLLVCACIGLFGSYREALKKEAIREGRTTRQEVDKLSDWDRQFVHSYLENIPRSLGVIGLMHCGAAIVIPVLMFRKLRDKAAVEEMLKG